MLRPIFAVALMLACAPGASSAPPAGSAAPNSVTSPVVRTAQTLSGQPLRLPQGKAEMVASAVDIPAGGQTSIHQHPWSRFVYVERGPLRITNQDTNQVDELKTGEVFAEVVAQWHQGHATGPQGARVIVIDVVPPGVSNMTMR